MTGHHDYDPIRIAGEWHSGQFSALYSLSSTGRVHGPEHRAELLAEIDSCLSTAVSYASQEDVGDLDCLRYDIQYGELT